MQIASYIQCSFDNQKIGQESKENITSEIRAKASLCIWLQEVHEALVAWVQFGDLAVTVQGF